MRARLAKTQETIAKHVARLPAAVVALAALLVGALVTALLSRTQHGQGKNGSRPAVRGGDPRDTMGRPTGGRTGRGNPVAHDIGATLATTDAETQPGGGISNAVERTGQERLDQPREPVEHRKPVGELLEENEQGPESRRAREANQPGGHPDEPSQSERTTPFVRQSIYPPEGTAAERADWYQTEHVRKDAYHEERYQEAEARPHKGYESRQHQLRTNWYAAAIGLAGILLVASPWIFSYAMHSVAMWASVGLGAALALVSVLEYLVGTRTVWERAITNWAPYESNWQYWTLFMLGALAVVAPWVLVFVATWQAFWVMTLVGLFVIAMAGSQIFSRRVNYPTI